MLIPIPYNTLFIPIQIALVLSKLTPNSELCKKSDTTSNVSLSCSAEPSRRTEVISANCYSLYYMALILIPLIVGLDLSLIDIIKL